MSVKMIVAIANDRAIGRNGDLLFHIGGDLRHFKNLTTGHSVIMGRKTFESLPNGALPRRRNIVVTRDETWSAPGVEVVHSIDDAIRLTATDDVFIIGGSEIYKEFLKFTCELLITRIFASASDADTFFPPFEEEWKRVDVSEMQKDSLNDVEYRFETYHRRK